MPLIVRPASPIDRSLLVVKRGVENRGYAGIVGIGFVRRIGIADVQKQRDVLAAFRAAYAPASRQWIFL